MKARINSRFYNLGNTLFKGKNLKKYNNYVNIYGYFTTKGAHEDGYIS